MLILIIMLLHVLVICKEKIMAKGMGARKEKKKPKSKDKKSKDMGGYC